MLRDKINKDDDCLSESETILGQLTDKENRAVMPAGKPDDSHDSENDDNNDSHSGFNNLAETEKIAYRLGQINTLTFVRKNLEFLEVQAIQALGDAKSFKKMGYSSNAQFAAAFGMSEKTFYNLKKSVQTLGQDTYTAMLKAGYSKKNVNFLAAKTDAKVEREDNTTFIKIGDTKFDIKDKDALEDAISNLEKEVANEKKKNENTQKELDLARDEADLKKKELERIKKTKDSIPTDENEYDSTLFGMCSRLGTWISDLGKIYKTSEGNEKLRDIFYGYSSKFSSDFTNAISKMEQ